MGKSTEASAFGGIGIDVSRGRGKQKQNKRILNHYCTVRVCVCGDSMHGIGMMNDVVGVSMGWGWCACELRVLLSVARSYVCT